MTYIHSVSKISETTLQNIGNMARVHKQLTNKFEVMTLGPGAAFRSGSVKCN